MALPPLSAPAPISDDMAPPAGDAAMDQPMDAGGWQPFATIMKHSETGEFKLVEGDEPEDGSEPGGAVLKDGPALLRELMARIEGGGGAEEGFAAGFKGEPDAERPPMTRPAPGM